METAFRKAEELGAIESGVDFEKRIAAIYQTCRRPEEIREAFDRLQAEPSAPIDDAMTRTRQQLLEKFDEEVHEKRRINLRASTEYRNRYEQMLMELTRHELNGHAKFRPDMSAFEVLSDPFGSASATRALSRLNPRVVSGTALAAGSGRHRRLAPCC